MLRALDPDTFLQGLKLSASTDWTQKDISAATGTSEMGPVTNCDGLLHYPRPPQREAPMKKRGAVRPSSAIQQGPTPSRNVTSSQPAPHHRARPLSSVPPSAQC